MRRVTRRHMGDTERRHIALVIQRVVLWSTIVAVTAFAFCIGFDLFGYFLWAFGSRRCGCASSVILSAVGYFVLVGRRGMESGTACRFWA